VRRSGDADDAAAQDDDIGRVGRRLLVHPAIMASCAPGVLPVSTPETANAPAEAGASESGGRVWSAICRGAADA